MPEIGTHGDLGKRPPMRAPMVKPTPPPSTAPPKVVRVQCSLLSPESQSASTRIAVRTPRTTPPTIPPSFQCVGPGLGEACGIEYVRVPEPRSPVGSRDRGSPAGRQAAGVLPTCPHAQLGVPSVKMKIVENSRM